MLTEPIEVGQRYLTRDGVEVSITSVEIWNHIADSSMAGSGSYGAVFQHRGHRELVFGNGRSVGRTDHYRNYPYDLVQLVSPVPVQVQLDLFS